MSDLLTDDEMVKMVREQADELESCAAAMRAAGAEIERLRLALATAIGDRDIEHGQKVVWQECAVRLEAERNGARAERDASVRAAAEAQKERNDALLARSAAPPAAAALTSGGSSPENRNPKGE